MGKKRKFLFSIIIVFCLGLYTCTFDEPAPVDPGDDDPVSEYVVPFGPSPAIDEVVYPEDVMLSWQTGYPATYDLWFEEGINPPTKLLATGIDTNRYFLPVLKENTQYFWQLRSGTDYYGPVWKFYTAVTNSSMYTMKLHELVVYPPEPYVFIMFQVLDLNNKGVTHLSLSDFEIYDDGASLSPRESGIELYRASQVNYEIWTMILIDNSKSLLPEDLSRIKLAVINLLNNLVPQQRVKIYAFSDKLYDVSGYWVQAIDRDAIENLQYNVSEIDHYNLTNISII